MGEAWREFFHDYRPPEGAEAPPVGTTEVAWVQEEARDMGAWGLAGDRLRERMPDGVALTYVGRSRSAGPATGSHKRHLAEQRQLVAAAVCVATEKAAR